MVDEILVGILEDSFQMCEVPINKSVIETALPKLKNLIIQTRIEEARLFNRYFDDNQAFKGFAQDRLRELGKSNGRE